MIFYALIDSRLAGSELGEVVEFYPSRDDAECDRQRALREEPTWLGKMGNRSSVRNMAPAGCSMAPKGSMGKWAISIGN